MDIKSLFDRVTAAGNNAQGPPYVLAMESRSPAMNFNTGATAITKDAAGPVPGVPAVPGAQPLSIGVKTPLKKPAVAVGQKKPGEAMPTASQPARYEFFQKALNATIRIEPSLTGIQIFDPFGLEWMFLVAQIYLLYCLA